MENNSVKHPIKRRTCCFCSDS